MASRRCRPAAVAEQFARRRERECSQREKWSGQVRYYKTFEKANSMFDGWTSPRYYETSNRMIETMKRESEKKESLGRRREKLRRLLEEEAKTYEIELTVRNRDKLLRRRQGPEEVPTELLRDLNIGLKVDAELRRKHEAELSLYHKWRRDNPILRDYERCRNSRDLKLSWLDQQIEKRMENERKEEECRRMLEERDKRLEEERLEEERRKLEREEKNRKLAEELAQQVERLRLKQRESEELRSQEDVEAVAARKLADLEEARRVEERRRAERECALENVRLYKMKLRGKALAVEENVRAEVLLLGRLVESDIADAVEDRERREEVKRALGGFLACARQQEELEKQRRRYLEFVFDSEARAMYERQNEVWEREQRARDALLAEVMATIRRQIEEKIERNVEKQKVVLEEREAAAKAIEERDAELRRLREEEAEARIDRRKELDRQVAEKKLLEQRARLRERKQIDEELERVRKEEERLKKEILNLQRRQQPCKPRKSKLFF